jgi:hypothetical protein
MRTRLKLMIVMAASLAFAGVRSAVKTVDTVHFTVRVPGAWQVALSSHDTNGWTYAFRDGTNQVFEASIWQGTGFLDCFCAPWDEYKVIEREHEEVRTIRLDDHARTLKIAGEKYSLDIHASHKGYDKRYVDGVLASIRMKRKEQTKGTHTGDPLRGPPAGQP